MLTVSEAAALLRSFDRVLILTHIRPDGDTVGCAAGLCAALRAIGKTAYLLPNPGLTENTAPYFTPYSAPADFVPEKVVSTDIATVGLFPDNAKSYADKVDLAIDHHPSFEGFGKANIVRPEAAACGELEREAAEKGALEVILNNDSWETDEDYLKLVLADYTEQVLEYQSEHPGLLVPKND